jgi:signal transduction histidine kinase
MNNPDSVIYYARLALSHGQRSLQKVIMLDASRQLTKYFLKAHQSDSVIKYQELNMALQDSLFGRKQLRNLQLLAIEEQKRIHEAEQRERQVEQEQTEYRNRIRLYTLLTASVVLLVLGLILFRNNRQKQTAKLKIEKAYQELKQTQAQLIQSEKMASLGELTAGIAHEIQNPLNFVNNFSEVSIELAEEMEDAVLKSDREEINSIASHIKENLQKIVHHGQRADAIVKGMLQHSRASSGKKEHTNINALCDEYLRLSYHGLRAKDKSFNATMETHFDENLQKIAVIPQDIGRVLLNLYNNAFYAVSEKQKQAGEDYEPTVTLSTKNLNGKVEIRVADNGNGIPQNALDKIFQPFFTTKPTGQGTGLGLSLSYDIIKAHGGELKVETKEGEGSEFIIQLPVV